MKKFLRKVRGKKDGGDGYSDSMDYTTSGFQQLAPSGPTTLSQASNAASDPSVRPGGLLASGSPSSTLQNPDNLMGVSSPQLCKECYNLDPSQSPVDGNPSKNDLPWALLEYSMP